MAQKIGAGDGRGVPKPPMGKKRPAKVIGAMDGQGVPKPGASRGSAPTATRTSGPPVQVEKDGRTFVPNKGKRFAIPRYTGRKSPD